MTGRMMAVWLIAALPAMGCIPNATDAELTQMCENLINLRGEIDQTSEKELIANVEKRFTEEAVRLKDWKIKDLRGWDEELEARLSETNDNAEKAKLRAEYNQKKEVTASKHDPGIAALEGKKKEAIEAAKKQALENQAAFESAVAECAAQSKKEGVTQSVAQCRINAETTDKYWNGCR